jgi:hypothetical protein
VGVGGIKFGWTEEHIQYCEMKCVLVFTQPLTEMSTISRKMSQPYRSPRLVTKIVLPFFQQNRKLTIRRCLDTRRYDRIKTIYP